MVYIYTPPLFLYPSTFKHTTIPEKAVRTGEEFDAGKLAVIVLQALLLPYPPDESAESDGYMPGFGLPFNFTTKENDCPELSPHLFNGSRLGMVLGLDDPHESNHGKSVEMMLLTLGIYLELSQARQLEDGEVQGIAQQHDTRQTWFLCNLFSASSKTITQP